MEEAEVKTVIPGANKNISDLFQALKKGNYTDRYEAAQALGGIGGEQALAGLLEQLEDKDRWVRMSATECREWDTKEQLVD